MILEHIFIFISSFAVLLWAGTWLVKVLVRIARFLGWKEFVVGFFLMAFAGSIPNIFLGVNSALRGIPQLSFGDVVGGNIVHLTLSIALAVFVSSSFLQVETHIIRTTTIFTVAIAVLPILLVFDGQISRGDGLILISTFIFYLVWLFSKEDRFKKIYNSKDGEVVAEFKIFLTDLAKAILAFALILVASEGVVRSSVFFAEFANLPLPLLGIFIIGFGNALPETYFAVISARKGKTQMILGDLMGSVIMTATLVLGLVALINPIKIEDFSPFAIARSFLVISAIFFFFVMRTGQKIDKKESLFLIFMYVLFIAAELLIK
ncbi:MAG: sodium:calcium antiporter [Candidatus Nealsonbacteria bacterium]|nr:sodium:calcium antiporter [Candidatus Nealsonbacteria bacterium]